MNNGSRRSWKSIFMTSAFTLLISPAWADVVSTEQTLAQSDRERVRAFMQRDGVEHHLKALGLAPELAKQRVDALTDAEIQVIAGKLDTLPAGGALSSTDWIIVLLLIILVLILI